MVGKDPNTPRVFLIRHGETEWSKSGRFTGYTDIPLTQDGEAQVIASSRALVGHGKVIDPPRLARIFISPRTRARRTYELLFDPVMRGSLDEKREITEDLREWDYGAYEGLLHSQIRQRRKEQGLDAERPWDIWVDGCEGGDTPVEMSARMDKLIAEIREMQGPFMDGPKGADVVVIAHGHSLRAFAKRWIGFELALDFPMILETGAVGVLSYRNHSVDEPALLLGINMGVGLEEEKK